MLFCSLDMCHQSFKPHIPKKEKKKKKIMIHENNSKSKLWRLWWPMDSWLWKLKHEKSTIIQTLFQIERLTQLNLWKDLINMPNKLSVPQKMVSWPCPAIDLTLWLTSCSRKISSHKSIYIEVWQCNFGWITMVWKENLWIKCCNAKLRFMAGLPSHRSFGNSQ